jgi:predicted secreted protein
VVVQVGGGKEAIRDLGVVALGSRHVVVFVVDNPTDQPLVFKSVRGDCECITPENPPAKIEANGSARVTAVYVAPKTPMVYESRLLIATDNPNRHVISLRVRSSPPVSGADSPVSHPVGTQRGD